MLNAALDREALADEYRRDQRIRIDNILQDDIAERIRSILSRGVPFEFAYFLDGAIRTVSQNEMAGFGAAEKANLSRGLMQNATQGIGFLYCRYRVDPGTTVADADTDADLRFLREVVEYLNSAEMLDFVRGISGRNDLVRADAQYTRYSAGQYLTRHSDDVQGETRKLAYVFGFTRNWHPDWGGLLQYFEKDGTPRDAWAPAFNRLVLFDVRHVHSVTYVAPFAGGDRLSMTGWFYADN
jgi:Rps23 Pro-64 3,4-dihydroxylase Tpa1-like proline 4-hydroxylase